MTTPNLETLLEATLFGVGRSISIEELAENLERSEEDISAALEVLNTTLKRRRGGA